MNLYVIRHGETNVNVNGLINGHNTIGLNETGIMQAKKASEEIGKLKLDLIFCSPLERTKETCSYININKIGVIYNSCLAERYAGDLEGKTIKQIDWDLWYDYTKSVIYNNTEGFKSVYDRITIFLNWLKENYKDKNILLVTHGDVFKAIYLYFNPVLKIKDILAYEKANCEIQKFEL